MRLEYEPSSEPPIVKYQLIAVGHWKLMHKRKITYT